MHTVIVEMTRRGLYVDDICARVGIVTSTYYYWIERGSNEESGRYRRFSDDVKRAAADLQMECLNDIHAARRTDWRAAAWILSRRFCEKWHEHQSVAVEDENDTPQIVIEYGGRNFLSYEEANAAYKADQANQANNSEHAGIGGEADLSRNARGGRY